MYALRRSFDYTAFWSDDFRDLIGRRVRECGGFVLVALAALAGLALATWSVKDPSLSHATPAPVHNLLGIPGAIADAVLRLPALLLGGPLSGGSRTAVAVITGTVALIALAVASGFGSRDA